MQAKLIRDMDGPNPKFNAEKAVAAKLAGRPYTEPHSIPLPAGTVIDKPDAYRLVQLGVAIPNDEACRIAAGMTTAEMQDAATAYAEQEKGLGLDGVSGKASKKK